MVITACKEPDWETRAVLTPAVAGKLVRLGAAVQVEAGLGSSLHITDDDYVAAGATVITDMNTSLAETDVIMRLNPPDAAFVSTLRSGSVLVSFLDPFQN